LTERGLWADGMGTEAAQKKMAECSDFAKEPFEVQNIMATWGVRKHIGIFLAKFHPGAPSSYTLALYFPLVSCPWRIWPFAPAPSRGSQSRDER
jgi:hypothetical protein